jgi:ATP-dependent DNA helicase MPH1
MAEGREDSHWESAQQTHREIQHEIMHSRNLQLFDDVERLLPPGQLPACIEQEMVVHDWKVDEPRKKRASLTSVPKRPRGEPLPEGAQVGFESVLDILQKKTGNKAPTKSRAKPKAKAKGKTKGNDADDAMSLSGDELPGIDELLKRSANSDSDSDDEAAAVKPPAKKSRKAPAKKTTAKKVLPSSSSRPPVPQPRASGIDFLIPEPVNRPVQTPWMASKLPKSPSPDAVLPSSTSPSPPPRANQPRAVSRLPPDIAAQAGFSQIDMSYVLEESDDEIMLRPKAAPVGQFSTPRPVGTNMKPPPVPSSPSIRTEGTPFPVRRIGLGARRRRIVTSSSDAASPHVPRRAVQSPDYEQQPANTEERPVLVRGRRRLPKQRLRQHDLVSVTLMRLFR